MILTYVAPDGTNVIFSRDAANYKLLKAYGGFAEIPATFQSDKSPGQHGSTLLDTLMDERDIWFDVYIRVEPQVEADLLSSSMFGDSIFGDMIFGNPTVSNLQSLQEVIKNLSANLNPLNGAGNLYYTREDGSVYRITCSGADNTVNLNPSDRSDVHQRATIRLRAHDPFWYYGSESRATIAPVSAGWIPWDIPWVIPSSTSTIECTNSGTTDTPVRISIWGAIVEPIITNVTVNNGVTTTETITTSITLAADDRLDITTGTDNETVLFTDGTAAPVKAFSYITVGSKFWLMKKGVNKITLTCTSSTPGCGCSIQWSDKYAGVL